MRVRRQARVLDVRRWGLAPSHRRRRDALHVRGARPPPAQTVHHAYTSQAMAVSSSPDPQSGHGGSKSALIVKAVSRYPFHVGANQACTSSTTSPAQ